MLWWPLGFFMMVFTLHQLFNSSPTLIFQTWARSSLHFLGLENLSNFNSSQDFHLYFWTDDAVELHLKCTKIWSFAFLGKCLELPYVLIFNLRRILTYLLPGTFEIRVFQHPRNIHKNCHASCSPQKMRFSTRLKFLNLTPRELIWNLKMFMRPDTSSFFVVLLFRFALIFHFWARISFFPTMIEAQHRMQTFDDKFVRLQGQSIKLIWSFDIKTSFSHLHPSFFFLIKQECFLS